MRKADNSWLLALDVDRTLLTDDYGLLPDVRDAVNHARRHGIIAVLATARGPVALEIVLRDLGDVDAVICFGGALVLEAAGTGGWREPMGPGTTVASTAKALVLGARRTLGVSLAAYTRSAVFVDELDRRLAREFSHTSDRYEISNLDTLKEPVFKCLAISKPEETDKLNALRVKLSNRLSYALSHANYLEIGSPGVSKGQALEQLASANGFGRERIVAVGDSENDLPMLAIAGHSIAMGNAAAAVKCATSWITLSNAKRGVAYAIERRSAELWHIPTPRIPLEME